MAELLDQVVALLQDTRAAAPDQETAATLDQALLRIGEPLRVAIAGRVKAGKSTLLNALVGDQLAPTDAGECTRIVTWYRNAHTYRVELHPRQGEPRQVPFRRDPYLQVDLGGTAVTDVDRLEVWWPSARLEDVTLVDTPGIGSISTDMAARTYEFLVGDEGEPAEADAVLYLLRHLHTSDVRFLEAFHDDELAYGTPVNAVGVLSRADEIGACRLGAMEAAHRVAGRYQDDPRIRQLCRLVVPVAGLLAQAGATLREEEFQQLASIGHDQHHSLVDIILTADRFVSAETQLDVAAEARRQLLDRLGLYGVRLALDLIRRDRVHHSAELATELLRASGIGELQEVLGAQLMARSQALKARSALVRVDAVLRSGPWADATPWLTRAEKISSSAHEIVEIQLLNDLWLGELALRDEEQIADMERLLGGHGTAFVSRLGLPEDAPLDAQREAAMAARWRWLRVAEHPLSTAKVRKAARDLVRSCEGMVAGLTPAPAAAPEGEEVR